MIFWLTSSVGIVVDVPGHTVPADVALARHRAVDAGLATMDQLLMADVETDAATLKR